LDQTDSDVSNITQTSHWQADVLVLCYFCSVWHGI